MADAELGEVTDGRCGVVEGEAAVQLEAVGARGRRPSRRGQVPWSVTWWGLPAGVRIPGSEDPAEDEHGARIDVDHVERLEAAFDRELARGAAVFTTASQLWP